MDKKKNTIIISVSCKLLLAVLLFSGILDRAGLFTGEMHLHTLYSFTTLSNAYAMVLSAIAARQMIAAPQTPHTVFSRLRYIGVISILITGIVYHFILLPEKLAANHSYQVFAYGNIIAHYIAPAGIFADWLLFDRKGGVSKWEPLLCASVPLLYFIVASAYGYYGSTIPGKQSAYVYFFMDWGVLGVAGVMRWVAILFCVVVSLTYAVYGIDQWLAKRQSA